MSCFGVESDVEVQQINTEIIEMVRKKEKEALLKRQQEGKAVMGAATLRSQPILKPHTPKKRERKVMILTSINELRLQLIEEFKNFCTECKNCYRCWLQGDFKVEWPPGAFRPPIPPNMNIVSF